MSRPFHSITAGELIALLQDLPEDAEIAFASDYGDRSHTQQAHPIKGDIRSAFLTKSAYSASGWAVKSYDQEEEDDDKDAGKEICIIS